MDGIIPKNKDLNNFTKDIQDLTPASSYFRKKSYSSAHKEGFKTYLDVPEDHIFGI